MRMLIASLTLVFSAIAAQAQQPVPRAAPPQEASPSLPAHCKATTEDGCVELCLEGARWQRIVDYRRARGQDPRWRAWICASDKVDETCVRQWWSHRNCSKACGTGQYIVYRRAKDKQWPDGDRAISCKID